MAWLSTLAFLYLMLQPETHSDFDWNLRCFPILASTNDLALEWLRSGRARPGDVIVAGEQTSGRGRPGRVWVSPRGALLMTAILPFAPFRPERAGWAALLAGIAVARAVRELGVPAGVKWPNDVVLGDAKLAGILVESSKPELLAVGIGLNVANELPPPQPGLVTARLRDLLPEITVEQALERVLAQLKVAWPLLRESDAATLRQAWGSLDSTAGRRVRWSHGHVEAMAETVADDGSLQLRLDSGVRVLAGVGEVVFIR